MPTRQKYLLLVKKKSDFMGNVIINSPKYADNKILVFRIEFETLKFLLCGDYESNKIK